MLYDPVVVLPFSENPMKRENDFGSSFHPGRYYKLLQPVGPIPAGVYRLEGAGDESLTFSVGNERSIIFSLAYVTPDIISEVAFSFGRRHRVRAAEFSEHYFDNVDRLRPEWTSEEHPECGPTLVMCSIPLQHSLLARSALLQRLFATQVPSDGWHSLIPLEFDA
jgi:hypothetical protein